MEAKLAHFYGWGADEIDSLPVKVFFNYLRAIPIIEAQQDLRAITISTFPDMKQETRKKVWKQLSKQANDFSRDDQKGPVTLEQIARRMAGKLGNG